MLPDLHNTIACISSVPQFNILEANKVKGLFVLHKTYRPFSFMLAPNSIALGLSLFNNLVAAILLCSEVNKKGQEGKMRDN